MIWNYRLILMDVSCPDEPWYEVHEVYYDETGVPKAWTEEAVELGGEDMASVLGDMEMIRADIQRQPVFKESEMPGSRRERK